MSPDQTRNNIIEQYWLCFQLVSIKIPVVDSLELVSLSEELNAHIFCFPITGSTLCQNHIIISSLFQIHIIVSKWQTQNNF